MSPRTGRPKSQDPINQQITVRLNADLMRKLEAYCEKKQTTKGEAIREGVKRLLETEKE